MLGGIAENSTGSPDSSAAVLAITPETIILAGLISMLRKAATPESMISGPWSTMMVFPCKILS
jgi:hypothetical protein